MPRAAKQAEPKPERLIMVVSGDSGTGKSFFVANLRRALIFDTDLGGGLGYLDARIKRNDSERVEVGSYTEVIKELQERGSQLGEFRTIAIDHLTALQQEAVLRYNPGFAEETYGKEHDKANKEWRKIKILSLHGDFNLVCTTHLKTEYKNRKAVGIIEDASKNLGADFHIRLRLESRGPGKYPSVAFPVKWRRDPEDSRGPIPVSFPFTNEKVFELFGNQADAERHALALATPEQIGELERLLDVVKVKEDWLPKVLAKAKAETPDDLTGEQIGKCLEYLQGLIGAAPKAPKAHDEEAA